MKRFFLSAAIAAILLPALPAGAQPDPGAPTGLTTDLLTQTGLRTDAGETLIRSSVPFFGWLVPGERPQRRYRILLGLSESALETGSGLLWDSGLVRSGQSTAVPYGGAALQPSTEYWWKVGIVTGGHKCTWSAPCRFKTAERLETYATPHYPLVKDLTYPPVLRFDEKGVRADFGKTAFGWLEADIRGARDGDTVIVHLGERLDADGHVLRNPTTTVRYQRQQLVLKKGLHHYRVAVTPDRRNTGSAAIKMPEGVGEVMPFRYVELDGCPPLEPRDIYRRDVHYPQNTDAASFRCDDDLLNDIWDLCLYSVKATSFTGYFVDGDRERIPYEADALIGQLCHYAADREYTLSRRSLEHLLAHPTWPTEWILQSVMIAWNDYLFTGDKRLIAQQYDLLKAHCLEALTEENGLISTRTGRQTPEFLASIRRKEAIRDIVDWPQKVPEVDGIQGGTDGFVFTDFNAVVNAFHYRALCDMERIARALGKEADAAHFAAASARVKEAFLQAFFDAENARVRDGIGTEHSSLHANVFALAFGLVPQEAVGRVTEYIVSKGMSCGVYAAQFLLEALYEAGAGDAALALMTARSTPSWYNMLKVGATITLEAWDDSFKPNQDWNHIWGAAPGNIIPFRLMGVRPLEPGWTKARIAPQPGRLQTAEVTVPTIKGDITVSLQPEAMEVTIPAGMTADISVPLRDGGEKRITAGAGHHRFPR